MDGLDFARLVNLNQGPRLAVFSTVRKILLAPNHDPMSTLEVRSNHSNLAVRRKLGKS